MHTDFADKFGIPRQSGLVPELRGRIVFASAYSRPDALRGLEAFSHIWLLWDFSEAKKSDGKGWSATVRPPRLGGNRRMGVFATRSPFRPNPIGLSCVKLEAVYADRQPVELEVSGIDLLDGTPIFDIKPYIPFADCHPDATEGYTAETKQHWLEVVFPDALLAALPMELHTVVTAILAQDPRPGYADDPERLYGIVYAGYDIKFTVADGVLTVCAVVPLSEKG